MVEDKQVKNFLQKAENFFENKQYRDAAKYLIMAFETAKTFRQFGQAGSMISVSRYNAEKITESKKGGPEILEYAKKIEQELEVLKLGLDYSQWLGYRRELGNVNPLESIYEDVDKELDIKSISLFEENDDSIEFWIRRNIPFVQESILRWQDSMLNIGDFLTKIDETLTKVQETTQNEN